MSDLLTLLIVDDSRMSRMLIRSIITQIRPQWRLLEAVSGDEALAMVEAHKPQYVSMDMNMPGISGMDASGRIRLQHPEIRIALCTANIQESVQQGAATAGLFFIKKPITEASIALMVACFEQ